MAPLLEARAELLQEREDGRELRDGGAQQGQVRRVGWGRDWAAGWG